MPRQAKSALAGKPVAPIRGRLPILPFFREVYAELNKVVWPGRPEALNLTVIVVIVSVAVGIALGLIDMVFSWLVNTFLLPPT